MTIRIMLVDDHQVVREGFRGLLQRQPDMEVVGEAGDGRTGVRLAEELKPNVVVMDVAMQGLNGVEATRQVIKQVPDVKVLALSMHPGKRVVGEMLQAGALGYLTKSCALEELVHAVRTVAAGGTYLSSSVEQPDELGGIRPGGAATGKADLSQREREVLQLVAEGMSTKEVAATLHVSTKTIETHRSNIMRKLGIHSIAELTKYAVREGLTPLEP
ncbi:MAG: response regulator transcription factor [Deltaproteobacteria bacterium]|nr:response regulator transcription factor [Deltaproteobacteria bacterium]